MDVPERQQIDPKHIAADNKKTLQFTKLRQVLAAKT
jgi:hypothetical protein